MKKILFKGCCTAIPTPFDENGVNLEEFGKLIEFQIQDGVDAILVCGTTGESSTMTLEEKKKTIQFAVEKANKRVPIIAGTGGNNTQACIEMTKCAESLRSRWSFSGNTLLQQNNTSRISCTLPSNCKRNFTSYYSIQCPFQNRS